MTTLPRPCADCEGRGSFAHVPLDQQVRLAGPLSPPEPTEWMCDACAGTGYEPCHMCGDATGTIQINDELLCVKCVPESRTLAAAPTARDALVRALTMPTGVAR